MPIEIKELIVRAWVDSQAGASNQETQKVAATGNETSDMQAEMLEQLKRILSDKKDR
ncbi:MAG TPA: DUF5908 family protein [Bacteroidia bacterium]|nr:DUF5908 family protein [Bacteroidia bacterium]